MTIEEEPNARVVVLAAVSTTDAFVRTSLLGETIVSRYDDLARLQCSLAWFGGDVAWALLRAGVAGALLHDKLTKKAIWAEKARVQELKRVRRLVESRAEEYVRWKSSAFVHELPERVTEAIQLPDDWRDLDFARLAERAFDVEAGRTKPLSDAEKEHFARRARS